jgi:hypothetical protein
VRKPESLALRVGAVIAAVILLWPSSTRADTILHPIAFVWPAAWLLFIPLVLIEAAIAVRIVGIGHSKGFWVSLWANMLSTLVGVPIGTCFNPVPLMFMWGSTPKGIASQLLFWTSLLFPLYLVSVIVEAWVAWRFLDESHGQKAWRWAWLGNLATYALISAGLAVTQMIYWFNHRGAGA